VAVVKEADQTSQPVSARWWREKALAIVGIRNEIPQFTRPYRLNCPGFLGLTVKRDILNGAMDADIEIQHFEQSLRFQSRTLAKDLCV
jgi:hypothetical protein